MKIQLAKTTTGSGVLRSATKVQVSANWNFPTLLLVKVFLCRRAKILKSWKQKFKNSGQKLASGNILEKLLKRKEY